MFIKQGQIITNFAQCPVVDKMEDRWRIYYSYRVDGKSHPTFVDVEPGKPNKVIYRHLKPIIPLGNNYDCDGVMPTFIMNMNGKKYLYYVGWKIVNDLYENCTCLAVGTDCTTKDSEYPKEFIFQKMGPILQKDSKELFTSTLWVLNNEIGVYLACHDRDENETYYDLKFARHDSGRNWNKLDRFAVKVEGYSVCSYTAVEGLVMWCQRTNGYRDYVIKGFPFDLQPSKTGWDSEMTAYPYLVEHEGKIFLFYNGNGFGATGIGYAIL